jgi:hypothetical protein
MDNREFIGVKVVKVVNNFVALYIFGIKVIKHKKL